MRTDNTAQTFSIEGAALVTPKKILKKALKIENKRIAAVGQSADAHFQLEQTFVFPGLINVHDHLRGNYLPKVGPPAGTFYLRCHDWEKDFRTSKLVAERSKVTEADSYFLSAYKNLFSGVTTVNDHYPHKINEQYIPRLPIRVIRNYTLHHEATSHTLSWWDEGIEVEHRRARKLDCPFIVHMEEGLDAEYQRGLDVVEELDCLDDHNVHVHCVGYSDIDIAKTKKAGATVVWCPDSNIFMYNVTCKIKKILAAGVNVALGTDSTATGSVNLLEELRFARRIFRKMYGEEMPARLLAEMVTVNPAKAFRLSGEIGSLEEGKLADVLVIRQQDDDPYESLLKTQIEDIALLLLEGDPILAQPEYEELFRLRGREFSKIKVRGQEMLVKGDPAGLLKRVREAVGFKKVLDFIPLEI